jgi:hypothetical protein
LIVLKGEASYDTLGDPPHPKAILVDAAGAPGQTLKNRILLENYYLHHGHVDVLVDCRGNQESLMVAIVGRKVGTAAAQAAGRLQFTADAAAALANADVAWVTFDTPVDENDVPQVVAVVEPVKGFLPHVPDGCLVLVSAQLPVGTTRRFGLQWANLNDTDNSVGNGPRQLLLSQCLLRIKAHGTRKER